MRRDTVNPSGCARDIVTVLVARHGLLQAVDIGRCIVAQLGAMVEQQKRLHPEDWHSRHKPTRSKQKKVANSRITAPILRILRDAAEEI